MGDENQPIVIDNGSGMLKAGFAGAEAPKIMFPTYVGRPKHVQVMVGPSSEYCVGTKVQELRGLLKIKYPIEHGIVKNWDSMEKIWKHMYIEMNVQNEDHPVLLTESPLNPKRNREQMARIFFETFSVPALYISLQSILSLYSSGRTTGVVIDCGDGVSHCVPVVEGFAMPHAILRSDVAGRDVTEYLSVLLRKAGINLHTTAEMEIVKQIKEELCYVSMDPQKEEIQADSQKISFKLPDGNEIMLGAERIRAPEVLFQPSLIGEEYLGVHELVTSVIARSDMDLRRELYQNILLSGGSTMFKGMGNRLVDSITQIAPKDIKVKVIAPVDRKTSAWSGGSLLASLPTFKKMWISKSEFEEYGDSVVHRKTF
eukprot:TRINITY_DN1548_c0_g1_i1.p1 TRINITY_DN1548_c0_g1~~TRINITY_DN1548_c0_g1_i1.p1  ORF type:complete len:371 (-),score=105.74 TRINITY_DN1548_c0_g1_i1:57-1169(-)